MKEKMQHSYYDAKRKWVLLLQQKSAESTQTTCFCSAHDYASPPNNV